jgi:hypothetical protein
VQAGGAKGPEDTVLEDLIERLAAVHQPQAGPHPQGPSSPGPRPVPQSHADRNLLFGILALQMDFISRDALIAAMNAWVLDKAQPLGRLLVAQQALGEDSYSLLEAVVAKHLAMHGGVEASLAAISSNASVQDGLKLLSDDQVQVNRGSAPRHRPEPGSASFARTPREGWARSRSRTTKSWTAKWR